MCLCNCTLHGPVGNHITPHLLLCLPPSLLLLFSLLLFEHLAACPGGVRVETVSQLLANLKLTGHSLRGSDYRRVLIIYQPCAVRDLHICASQTRKCNEEYLIHVSNLILKLPKDGLKHQYHPGVMVDVLNDKSDIFIIIVLVQHFCHLTKVFRNSNVYSNGTVLSQINHFIQVIDL